MFIWMSIQTFMKNVHLSSIQCSSKSSYEYWHGYSYICSYKWSYKISHKCYHYHSYVWSKECSSKFSSQCSSKQLFLFSLQCSYEYVHECWYECSYKCLSKWINKFSHQNDYLNLHICMYCMFILFETVMLHKGDFPVLVRTAGYKFFNVLHFSERKIVKGWKTLMSQFSAPISPDVPHKFHSPPHTGLWSLGRWHLSPKFGKLENWLKVIMFDVKQHSG